MLLICFGTRLRKPPRTHPGSSSQSGFAICAWRIANHAATGRLNNPRQWVCHRNRWRAALLITVSPPASAQEPIKWRQVRRTSARPVDHQELLLHQSALGGNGPRAAGPEKFRDRGQQVSEEDEELSHGDETRAHRPRGQAWRIASFQGKLEFAMHTFPPAVRLSPLREPPRSAES